MRKDIEYYIQYLTSEEEKRRAGKEYDRETIYKLDLTLYFLTQSLPERTRNFLEYSSNQQAYIAYIMIKEGKSYE